MNEVVASPESQPWIFFQFFFVIFCPELYVVVANATVGICRSKN